MAGCFDLVAGSLDVIAGKPMPPPITSRASITSHRSLCKKVQASQSQGVGVK
jgi:hypothetical protein